MEKEQISQEALVIGLAGALECKEIVFSKDTNEPLEVSTYKDEEREVLKKKLYTLLTE